MFDYESPDVPATAVADVVSSITNHGRPPPLSEDEKIARRTDNEIYLLECRQRDEQRRLEYQAAQEQAAAEAERQAAILAQREREEWRREHEARERERRRDSELVGLRIQAAAHESWRQGVERAAHSTVRQRYQNSLMAALDAMISPPLPPPEPETVFVQEDDGSSDLGSRNFDVGKWSRKPRSWW